MLTAQRKCTSSYLSELRQNGCLKIRITDPKRISRERGEVSHLAIRLGRSVSTSYRYPWLYVLLGDRQRESLLADPVQTHQRRPAKDLLRTRTDLPGLVYIQDK